MKHMSLELQAIYGAVTAILASDLAFADPTSTQVPCIRTGGDVVMKIVRAGLDDQNAQQVNGVLTAWHPQTTSVSFRSYLTNQVEEIGVKTISFEVPRINPTAQSPHPKYESIGSIRSNFPGKLVTVSDGILRFPGCISTHGGTRFSFKAV